jgi:hypothetical protein
VVVETFLRHRQISGSYFGEHMIWHYNTGPWVNAAAGRVGLALPPALPKPPPMPAPMPDWRDSDYSGGLAAAAAAAARGGIGADVSDGDYSGAEVHSEDEDADEDEPEQTIKRSRRD